MIGGYAGNTLILNLNKHKTRKAELEETFAKKYIGGTGFCTRLLYDKTKPDTDPLGPENRLVFANGPFIGTNWPASTRFNVAAKSPLTGIWGESNAGGNFGLALKSAGFDSLIVEGKSSEPVYLWIREGEAELIDASHIWGKSTDETAEIIREDVGHEDLGIAAIGQGGENLVRFANIMSNMPEDRANARSGMGAVMGSKKLKAVAATGSQETEIANPDRFKELVEEAFVRINENPFSETFHKYGTNNLTGPMSEIGRFPTRNFQTGVFPQVEEIDGDALLEYVSRDYGCPGCPLTCKKWIEIKSGPYAGESGSGPEYETTNAFGGRVDNSNLELILKSNWLCNQYGIDTIETGEAIAFSMELWEKGIIGKEDTGGLDFSWGNKEVIEKMIHKIAKREGWGEVLADGVAEAASKIGNGAEKYAMHVKGLAVPAQDGRAQRSMGLAHATSARGADHLRHCSFLDEIGIPELIEEKFGKEHAEEMANRLTPDYKGVMAQELEEFTAICDSLPLCIYTLLYQWWEGLTEAYNAITGQNISSDDMRLKAQRIVNLRRAYNIRLCLDREQDTLPKRFLDEPAPDGPCKGHTVELDEMLDEYYENAEWDKETGLIPKEKLLELGLEKAADDLENLGKLPG